MAEKVYDHSPKPADCANCTFAHVPRVGSRGKWDSPIVVIGEGPGIQEVKYKQPFVGPSGNLLEECWPKDLGLNLADCFVVNAIQCLVPGTMKGNKNTDRLLHAVTCCRQRLIDQIALAPRKVIIALGKAANASLHSDPEYKIMSRRGSFEQVNFYGTDYTVMPMLHPAFLLRGQGNVNHFKVDLRRGLLKGVDRTDDTYTEAVPIQLSTPEAIYDLISLIEDKVEEGNVCYADTDIETGGFKWHTDEILCVGLWFDFAPKYGWIVDWDRVRIEEQTMREEGSGTLPYYEAVFRLLTHARVKYNWHNGKFDVKFLRYNKVPARVDSDTFLMSYSLDERPGSHGLEEIAKNRLGAPNYKDKLKPWLPTTTTSYRAVPKPVLWKYLADDVRNTGGIREALSKEVNADVNVSKLYHKTLLPASEMLTQVEMRGIAVDMEFVKLNDKELNEEAILAKQEVSELAGYEVNPNSPPQVSMLLYDQLGLKLNGRRPQSTAKEILDKLPPHPVVKAIRKYRKIVKALGTYVHAIAYPDKRSGIWLPKHLAPDGRIHTTFNLGGTRTGRLASSGPNIQNIPREARLRRMYCASPGKILVEADYNTAELRMLAALSQDEVLIAIFMDDTRNLHDEVSVQMYGPDFTPDQRIRAKAINFGIPYGREAFSIAAEFDMDSVSEAQELIDAWFIQFPQAKIFLDKCRNAPEQGLTLVNAFGRKCRPGVVAHELLHQMRNEFSNFFMQSTISDFGLHAAMEIQPELQHKIPGAGIVNLVHDSILIECFPEDKEEVSHIMQKHMEGVPKLWIQTPIEFTVDFKTGQFWGLLKKE